MNKKAVFSLVLFISILVIPLTGMQAVEEYRLKPARIMLQSPSPAIQPVRREKAIELEGKRTEQSKTFVMPDQTQMIRAYPYAIHVKDRDGKWVDRKPLSRLRAILSISYSYQLRQPCHYACTLRVLPLPKAG